MEQTAQTKYGKKNLLGRGNKKTLRSMSHWIVYVVDFSNQ